MSVCVRLFLCMRLYKMQSRSGKKACPWSSSFNLIQRAGEEIFINHLWLVIDPAQPLRVHGFVRVMDPTPPLIFLIDRRLSDHGRKDEIDRKAAAWLRLGVVRYF